MFEGIHNDHGVQRAQEEHAYSNQVHEQYINGAVIPPSLER